MNKVSHENKKAIGACMDGDKKKKKRVGYGMDFRKLIKKRKTKRSKNVEEWEIG